MPEEYLLKVIISCLVFLLPFPFYFNFYHEWTISLVVILAGCGFLILIAKNWKEHIPVKLDLLDQAMLLFIMFMILSLTNTVHLGHSLKFLIKWSFLWSIYFLMRLVICDARSAYKLIKVAVLSGVVLALLGIWQHFQTPERIFTLANSKLAGLFIEPDTLKEHLKVGEWGVNWLLVENKAVRSFGTFADVINFAAYLSFVFSFALAGLLSQSQNKRQGVYWGLAVMIISFAILFSYVRGAWVACLLALICVLAVSSIKKKQQIVLLILSLLVLMVIVNPAWRERFSSIFNPSYSTNATRLQLWQQAIKDMSAHPFLGNGLADYGYGNPQAIPVHNNFLQIGVEMGLLALFNLLAILVLAFRKTLTQLKATDPYRQFIGWGAFMALIFFIVEGSFGTFMFDDKYLIFFTMILTITHY